MTQTDLLPVSHQAEQDKAKWHLERIWVSIPDHKRTVGGYNRQNTSCLRVNTALQASQTLTVIPKQSWSHWIRFPSKEKYLEGGGVASKALEMSFLRKDSQSLATSDDVLMPTEIPLLWPPPCVAPKLEELCLSSLESAASLSCERGLLHEAWYLMQVNWPSREYTKY